PTRADPKIVACSFIASGLRLFDISDLSAPKEIGYFVAPTKAKFENGYEASDFAMSMPAFAPERREVWFSDGPTGLYALRVAKDVWPEGAGAVKGCKRSRKLELTLHLPRGTSVRRLHAKLGGHKLHVLRTRGSGRTVRVVVE